MYIMGGLALNSRTLDRYFRHLKRLDNNSKKGLIIKLTESLEFESSSTEGFELLFGAWEDSRDSDSIISDIYNSRVDSKDIEEL